MNALLFIPLLGLTWAFGFFLLTVASHYFLAVLESSAAGSDRVILPDEPLTDWFWKGFYLGFLALIWGAPGYFLTRAAAAGDPGQQLVLLVGWVWLLFPVGILSSLGGSSRWIPLWPGLFRRVAQRPGKVALFYLFSAPVVAGLGAGFFATTLRPQTEPELLLALAPLTAAAFLVYARLLGRVGLVLTFTKGGVNEPKPKKPRRRRPARPVTVDDATPEAEGPAPPQQPSEMPGVMSPMDGEVVGYNVRFDDRPPEPVPAPVLARQSSEDDEEDGPPLRMEEVADAPEPARAQSPQEERALKPPPASELDLFDRRARELKEPAYPFDATSLTFVFQRESFQAWTRLSLGLLLFGFFVFALRGLRPD